MLLLMHTRMQNSEAGGPGSKLGMEDLMQARGAVIG